MRSLFVALSLVVASVANGQIYVDFNTSGDLAANFSSGDSTGVSSQGTTAGFNGTGGVTFSGVTLNHAWAYNTGFQGDLSSWFVEGMVRLDENMGIAAGIGFTTLQSPLMSGQTITSVSGTSDPADVLPYIGYYVANNGQQLRTGTTNLATQTPGDLGTNNWYRMRMEVSYLGGNQYDVTGTTYSVDSTGQNLLLLSTSSSIITQASLAADSDVYVYFSVHKDVGAFDNFGTSAVVVPEPATYAMMAGFLTLGVVFVARRKKL